MEDQFDREVNINFQAELLAKRAEPLTDFDSTNESIIDPPLDHTPVSLSRENILDIQYLAANPQKTIAGRFLLCRTITRAVETQGTTETVVEDQSGKLVCRLQLHYVKNMYSFLSCLMGKLRQVRGSPVGE